MDNFPLWEGHLFSFKVCDEQLAAQTGTSCSCFDSADDAEICVLGATDGQAVSYDQQGHLQTGDPYWDTILRNAGGIQA